MKVKIQSVKGTRDFYPQDMAVRSWLYSLIRTVSSSFGYQEYEGPVLEKIDLYAAKSGEELVKEQAFVFQDRGGESITLRPELTPTLARMVAQRQNELVFPLRWWSFGPFWRYERPQKGRSREFFQWNIDIIGASSPEADAELVAVCAAFFAKAGLDPQKVKIFVNSRRLMDNALAGLNIGGELKSAVFRLVDRRDKMNPQEWEAYGLETGLSRTQLDGLIGLLGDRQLWHQSDELKRIFTALEALGAMDYVQFEPQIIRGLDYYTGIVFEARDLDGGRSILGGGRYDNLVADVGGEPLAGVGFAMGDVMAGIVLEKYGCIPQLNTQPAALMVTVFDESRLPASFAIAAELRRAGLDVMCYPEAARLPKQFKYADRLGMRYVLVEGPDEEARGEVTLKNLADGSQSTIARRRLVETIRQMLAPDGAV